MAQGITILEGGDLRDFYAALGVDMPADVYRARVWATSDGSVKVKVNESIWTWALGEADKS